MNQLNLAKSLIQRAQNVSILAPQNQDLNLEGDVFCAGIALFYTLKKLKKNTNLYLDEIPQNLCFLIKENTFRKRVRKLKRTPFSFQPLDNDAPGEKVDLSISLGVKDSQKYSKQERINLNRVAVLNLSHRNFKKNNLIKLRANSISEIATELIKSLDENLLDKNIATCLLAGTIWGYENFRSPRTRPQALEACAYLIQKGADHQKIIHNLYKTKTVPQIKLLGQILKKVDFDSQKKIYFVNLTKADFQNSQCDFQNIDSTLEELRLNFGNLVNAGMLILWKNPNFNIIKGAFFSPRSKFTKKILMNFEGRFKEGFTLFSTQESEIDSAYQKFSKIIKSTNCRSNRITNICN